MKASKKVHAPAWAVALVEDVALKSNPLGLKAPNLVWEEAGPGCVVTNGFYDVQDRTIHICAGEGEAHHRVVLLHELAHWQQACAMKRFPRGLRWHTVGFFKSVLKLCEKFGADMDVAVRDECSYKWAAVSAAKQMGYEVPRDIITRWEGKASYRRYKQERRGHDKAASALDSEGKALGLRFWVQTGMIEPEGGGEWVCAFAVLEPAAYNSNYFNEVVTYRTAEEVRAFFAREVALRSAREAVAA